MQFVKRIFLFMLVNVLVVTTISILIELISSVSNIDLSSLRVGDQTLDLPFLALSCLLWGFVGSFISLGLSRILAKWMQGVKLIDERNPQSEQARWLLQTVYGLAAKAGIKKMPQVGIYESPEVNAFATGPTKNRSLVAVSSGLIQTMDRAQIEGVLAHEVAHITNGDMVTLTLIQGVINAFVMFFARIVAFAIAQNVREESRHMVRMLTTFVFEILFSFLGFMVVAMFSRWREFRADAGGARLAGKDKMIAALQGLNRMFGTEQSTDENSGAIAAFKISSTNRSGLKALFSTHPPLEERIRRLQAAKR
jgi:heat shock protein HtpX